MCYLTSVVQITEQTQQEIVGKKKESKQEKRYEHDNLFRCYANGRTCYIPWQPDDILACRQHLLVIIYDIMYAPYADG